MAALCRSASTGSRPNTGSSSRPKVARRCPVEKAIRFLFEKLITTEHFLNVFLENGARFYQDTGCHPEYATPECASPSPADRLRQGRRADPRGPPDLRRGEDPRRAHRREALDLQEQHRLRRQQLRLPRELPRRSRRRLLLPGRAADSRSWSRVRSTPARARSSRPRTACTTASVSARSTSTRRSRARRPTIARSSTPATSPTPTARSIADCT